MTHRAIAVLLWVLAFLASCVASAPYQQAETEQLEQASWQALDDGQLLAWSSQGDVERGAIAFEVCQGCHRRRGAGRPNGSYPRLAGQHASVLMKQLRDIQSGLRTNHKMLPFADASVLGPQQISDVAAYLQAQVPDQDNGRGMGDSLDVGKRVFDDSCARCHGASGEGDAEQFVPRLAGQHYRYLLREVKAIRDGQRGNSSPEMVDIVREHSEAELAAACDFASRLSLN